MGSRGPVPGRRTQAPSADHEDDAPGGPAARLEVLRRAFMTEAEGQARSDVLTRLDRAIVVLERELCLTPMARARANVPPADEPDELDTWLEAVTG